MLSQRGVSSHAHYLRVSDSPDGPIQSFLYSVEDTDISIRNLDFPGANPSQLPILHDIAKKKIEEGEYLRSKLAAIAKVALSPVYLKQGFLKVAFGNAQADVVSVSPKETIVDVKLPVAAGRQYRVAEIVPSGSTTLRADKPRPLIHINDVQPPHPVQHDNAFRDPHSHYAH